MRKKHHTATRNTTTRRHGVLKHIFPGKTSDEFKLALKNIKTKSKEFHDAYNNKIDRMDGSELLKALEEYEMIQKNAAEIQSYIDLRHLMAVEKKNTWTKNTQKKLRNIMRDLVFFKSEIYALPEHELLDRMTEEPALTTYTPWLRKQRSYSGIRLPTDEELYIYDQQNIHHNLKELWAELAFPLNHNPFDTLFTLINETDTTIRHKAFDQTTDEAGKNADMLLQLLHNRIRSKQTLAALRGFDNPEDAWISASQTPSTVIQHIHNDLQNALVPLTAQFYKRKSQLNDTPHLHPADVLLMPTPKPNSDCWSKNVLPKLQAELPLKQQDIHIINHCKLEASTSLSTPFYVLPSGQEKMLALCMDNLPSPMAQIIYMAHGLGKAAQEQHASANNTYLNQQPLPAFEKISGYFAEYLAIDALLEQAGGPEEKQSIIEFQLERNLQILSLQTALVSFNQSVKSSLEKNGALSSQDAEKIWKSTLQNTFGPAVDYDIKGLETLWAESPSMFADLSSAYQDIIGMVLATKIYQDYRNSKNKGNFLSEYHNFLGSGQSKQGKTLLTILGIDLEDSKLCCQSLNFLEERLLQLRKLDKDITAQNNSDTPKLSINKPPSPKKRR